MADKKGGRAARMRERQSRSRSYTRMTAAAPVPASTRLASSSASAPKPTPKPKPSAKSPIRQLFDPSPSTPTSRRQEMSTVRQTATTITRRRQNAQAQQTLTSPQAAQKPPFLQPTGTTSKPQPLKPRTVKSPNNTTKIISNNQGKMSPLQKREVTGQRQSPIDIQPTNVNQNTRAKRSAIAPLSVDYRPITGASGLTVENTGHGWKLNIPDAVAKLCPVTGGPLGGDQYRLLQIHSHWGCDDTCGSEHTVQGKSFPCEVHLVHWNVSKYQNPGEAMECSEDGLAVIGVFVEIGERSAPLAKICDHLSQIQYKGEAVPFDSSNLDLNAFLPNREDLKYWNYEGSLTTPPFSESVIWIVLEQSITASAEQIAQYRQMNKNCAGEDVNELAANWRDVQPLYNRAIAYFD